MKKLAVFFGALAIILSNIMCAAVAYLYRDLVCLGEHGFTALPASFAFLYVIPYGIGIIISVVLSVVFYRRYKSSESPRAEDK